MGWMTGMFVVALLAAAGSIGCFRLKSQVERDVAAGKVQIRLGEDITGPSYQIAFFGVFGFIFAAFAIAAIAIWMSGIGTRV